MTDDTNAFFFWNDILISFLVFADVDLSLTPSSSCLLPDEICVITASDPFLFSVTCWATVQLLWTTVLLAGQLYQVVRQMTTFEVSNLGRYGFMGGRGGTSLASQMGHRHQHAAFGAGAGAGIGAGAGVDGDGSSVASGQGHHHKHGGCLPMIMQLTGLDAFTRGRAADGLARASKASNPFDMGVVGNCKDFWSAGKELGVEYERLYEVPPEGFREAKRRRERDAEENGRGAKRPSRHFMGFSLGFGGRGTRAGYEPLNQV